jgi:hypothetical protein
MTPSFWASWYRLGQPAEGTEWEVLMIVTGNFYYRSTVLAISQTLSADANTS